ncbi:MAG: hypothetical protein LBF59_05570 [Prevotellaceae bacterium]|jgi:hypothetical protein|nr:hypothetical protein [Prevotellaceae bacterium]
MATLKAQSFELEFLYHNLNNSDEIEYAFDVKWEGRPFFNPENYRNENDSYYIRNGKFIVQESMNDGDWLMCFFIDLLKTREGQVTNKCEPPEIVFKATTWEDKRAAKEKSWEEKTCAVGQGDGTITHEPYTETMKMFIPLWENDIEFSIEIPSCEPEGYFESKQYTSFMLTVKTTFDDLLKFVQGFQEEMYAFYCKYADRIKYLGSGKYEVINKE